MGYALGKTHSNPIPPRLRFGITVNSVSYWQASDANETLSVVHKFKMVWYVYLEHGVTKYANLIGPLRESISLRNTPFSTYKTLTQGAFQAGGGSERSRKCQTTHYLTVCTATPIVEQLNKCFTLIANVSKSTMIHE